MKKSVLALAGAAAMGTAASSHAVEFRVSEDTELEIYGSVELIYVDQEVEDTAGVVESQDELTDNGSTIGVAGSHRLNDDLTGYFRFEWEHRVDEAKRFGGINDGDQAYVGLQGRFGDVRAGSWDGIYKDSIADVIDYYEYESPSSANRSDEGDMIAYFSPEIGGFSLEIAAQIKGEGEDFEDDDERAAEDGTAVLGVLKYDAGVFGARVGIDTSETRASDTDPTYGAAVTLDLAPVALAAKYERSGEWQDATGAIVEEEADLYGIGAEIDYGMGILYASAQQVDPDVADDWTEFQAGVSYDLADNFYLYAEGGWFDQEDDLGDYVGAGTVYAF